MFGPNRGRAQRSLKQATMMGRRLMFGSAGMNSTNDTNCNLGSVM